jgi:hypothetical protein
MDRNQRSPEQLRQLVIEQLQSHTAAHIDVPLAIPVGQDENRANWQMVYTGDPQYADVFNTAVLHVQQQWDAFE